MYPSGDIDRQTDGNWSRQNGVASWRQIENHLLPACGWLTMVIIVSKFYTGCIRTAFRGKHLKYICECQSAELTPRRNVILAGRVAICRYLHWNRFLTYGVMTFFDQKNELYKLRLT